VGRLCFNEEARRISDKLNSMAIVGKTSVVTGIISAFQGFHWTAIKITHFGHGRCPVKGGECACSDSDHTHATEAQLARIPQFPVSHSDYAFEHLNSWLRSRLDHHEKRADS
jgi:hypothetical protein